MRKQVMIKGRINAKMEDGFLFLTLLKKELLNGLLKVISIK